MTMDQYPLIADHGLIGDLQTSALVATDGSIDWFCAPRFGYGRDPHEVEVTEDGAVFRSAGTSLTAHLVREPDDQRLARTVVDDRGDLHAELTLTAGQVRGLIVETGVAGPPRRFTVAEVERLQRETTDFWEHWLGRSTYTGRWREQLNRSAITLKLMTYAPSGGLVAAPTAALPEQVGGERNWDYRYTWIRDASFSVYALLGLGFTEEAAAFGDWLRSRVEEQAGNASGPLKIMYRVDGSSDLTEETLDHLDGYMGSRPVLVGNAAAEQLQLDIYGEALDSLYA